MKRYTPVWLPSVGATLQEHPTGEYVHYTDAQAQIQTLRTALEATLRHAEINTCTHEETYRGGAIWTICSRCHCKWADDEGGFPGFVEPAVFEQARAALEATKEKE